MPTLRTVTLLSRRLLWPGFSPEPYLEVSDLERAIEISKTDVSLGERERQVLHNIVSLCDIRVDEWMRPRMQFLAFCPPVTFADLEGQLTPSGYLLVTDRGGDEVSGAIGLKQMSPVGEDRLERYAEPVIYVPWCTTVANVLDQMVSHDREVAAVVNELGETVGILTFDELLGAILTTREGGLRPSGREAIRSVSDGVWEVTGTISLRRLARRLNVASPSCRSVTVLGVLQELLQRLPQTGDSCRLGPLHFDVVDAPERGQPLVRVRVSAMGENGE
jgi:CBS domain containing-hemolysin-like protein